MGRVDPSSCLAIHPSNQLLGRRRLATESQEAVAVTLHRIIAIDLSPTLEVMLTVDPATLQKRFDPDTDLTLIDPASK